MKRVLSIMLTMMLVFSLFTGVITVQTAEYEVVSVPTGGNDFSTILTKFATAGNYFIQNVDSSFTSFASQEKEDVSESVSSGVTSKKVIALATAGSKSPTLRFRWSTGLTIPVKTRIRFKVYLENANETGTYHVKLQTQHTGKTSSAGGVIDKDIAANQWLEVDEIVTSTTTTVATTNGFKLTITNNTGTSAYPTTVYLDGNIVVEQVQEVEPSVALAECFQNDMVLQRNKPIKVWGTSKEAGKTVTVSLGNQTKTTTTDSDRWEVEFDAMEAQTGLTLTMSCNDAAKTNETLKGIAIGDVIIAAGQSNMNASLVGATGSEAILADTQTLSQISLLNMGSSATSNPKWIKAESADAIKGFTAIGLATAYNIAREYNIPVGVIKVSIGGASIKSFLSDETVDAREEYADFTKASESENNIDNIKVQATGLYNLWFKDIVGLKASSVLWYQGEEDAEFANDVSANLYSYMLYDLINQMRADFGDSNTPVAVCQLAPYESVALDFIPIRQSQLDTAKRMNGVYLVSTADLGPKSSAEGIHPANKLPIAERCAEIIKHHNYKKENVAYSGPEYEKYDC